MIESYMGTVVDMENLEAENQSVATIPSYLKQSAQNGTIEEDKSEEELKTEMGFNLEQG